MDDAYLGGELASGKAGRGSENKVPFVAAVSLDAEGHPLYAKMAPAPGFTRQAIGDWAKANLSSGCRVISDGLAGFAGVTDAGYQYQPIIVGGHKSKDLPEFSWVNTVLGNLKTSFGGACHAFNFAKYGCATWPPSLTASTGAFISTRSHPPARRRDHRTTPCSLALSG